MQTVRISLSESIRVWEEQLILQTREKLTGSYSCTINDLVTGRHDHFRYRRPWQQWAYRINHTAQIAWSYRKDRQPDSFWAWLVFLLHTTNQILYSTWTKRPTVKLKQCRCVLNQHSKFLQHVISLATETSKESVKYSSRCIAETGLNSCGVRGVSQSL